MVENGRRCRLVRNALYCLEIQLKRYVELASTSEVEDEAKLTRSFRTLLEHFRIMLMSPGFVKNEEYMRTFPLRVGQTARTALQKIAMARSDGNVSALMAHRIKCLSDAHYLMSSTRYLSSCHLDLYVEEAIRGVDAGLCTRIFPGETQVACAVRRLTMVSPGIHDLLCVLDDIALVLEEQVKSRQCWCR